MLDKGSTAGHQNVVRPKYKYSERLKIDVEVDIPPEEMFMPLGYDLTPGGG